jgi:streptomycin 3"-adenylyltransferase
VDQRDVRPWRYPPRLDFQFGDWYRPDFARGDFAPWNPSNPDLAIVLEMVLQADRPLFGPPPSELFGPIPWADIRQAMLDSISDLLADLDGDERNVVLTFARIWTTLATGAFRSKDGAADWAIPRLPREHRAVLAHARLLYVRGVSTEDWGDLLPRVRPFVDYVVGQITRAAALAPVAG